MNHALYTYFVTAYTLNYYYLFLIVIYTEEGLRLPADEHDVSCMCVHVDSVINKKFKVVIKCVKRKQ